VKFGK
jgi:hypothetical protein